MKNNLTKNKFHIYKFLNIINLIFVLIYKNINKKNLTSFFIVFF